MATTDTNIKATERRLDDLISQVRVMTDYDEKHMRRTVLIKIVVILFILGYLTWIYTNLRTIDANLVVFSAVERVNEAIPTIKEKMVAQLQSMAPGVIDQTGKEIIANLPDFRKNVQENVKILLTNYSDSVEKDVKAWSAQFVTESKAVINELEPEGTSFEKITKVRSYIFDELKGSMQNLSTEIGSQIGGHSLIPNLKHLLYAKNLSEKEKLQRDVIALAYLLVEMNLDDLRIEIPEEQTVVQ